MMNALHRLGALTAVGALTFGLATSAIAQGRQPPGTLPQMVLRKLSVNAEQREKIKTATDAYREEVQKSASLTGREKRMATRKAREAYEAAVKAALTPEQQTQLEQIVAGSQDFKTFAPMAMQLAALDLSSEQKTKLKEIAAKYEPELQKLRDEQKSASDKAAVQAKIREMSGKAREEATAALTEEQQKQIRPRRQQ